ncbi:MAG: 50S ribosomal protein L16 [Chlamydiae bacterium]|nr:50S ribosomal protein L16 [Chlamydiota bacterium]
MVLIPVRTKHRKQQKGSLAGLTKGGEFIEFGEFGMQALERGKITNRQIEACRVAISRYFSRKGKVWIRVFPDKPITKKPAETRMGKGKGAVDHWVAPVKPGRILFEVANASKEDAQNALVRAAAKLGIKTRFVERVEQV